MLTKESKWIMKYGEEDIERLCKDILKLAKKAITISLLTAVAEERERIIKVIENEIIEENKMSPYNRSATRIAHLNEIISIISSTAEKESK